MTSPGIVYLVGAGPGRPSLITVEGVRKLRRADVIVYDYLANPRLLDHAPEDAVRVLVGKHGGGETVEQKAINHLLVEHARTGKVVVRLKGGDPFVFGRGAEEVRALQEARIAFEIVPGVSSALAVPAYAGIPLTDRDHASSFTVLTGYEYPGKSELAVRWDAIPRTGGTLVLLMTTRQLRNNMAKLISNGLAADTPVAVIRWGSVSEQEVLTGTAATIAEIADAAKLRPPALAVVGKVVNLRKTMAWFERKPLFGRNIAVTRPRAQAADLIEKLEDLGADVLAVPTIEIVDPDSWDPVDHAIDRVEEFDWVVFTSVNGVERFMDRLLGRGKDGRSLYGAKLAAVGPATGAALRARGLSVDVIPGEFRAEGVAAAMSAQDLRGTNVLLPRASAAREVLPKMLQDAGAIVHEVHVYNTVAARRGHPLLEELIDAGRLDMVTFTSSSTVRNFFEMLGGRARAHLHDTALACIGPITADTVRDFGHQVAVSADPYTIEGLSAAIVDYFTALAAGRAD